MTTPMTINNLSTDLLEQISKFVQESEVEKLRTTCKSKDGEYSELVEYQNKRFLSAKKIQKFWKNKRIPGPNHSYWEEFPWQKISDEHKIHEQYKRLLICHYPQEYIKSMSRKLLKIRNMEIDENKLGKIYYFNNLVRTSKPDDLYFLGW